MEKDLFLTWSPLSKKMTQKAKIPHMKCELNELQMKNTLMIISSNDRLPST